MNTPDSADLLPLFIPLFLLWVFIPLSYYSKPLRLINSLICILLRNVIIKLNKNHQSQYI
jgi:hypothetical protein